MRRLTLLLALVISFSALPACAYAESAATAKRSQAVAFANAVNLRESDLPSFSVAPADNPEIEADRRLEHALRGCVTPYDSKRALAEVGSSGFGREASSYEQSASSEVSVARAPKLLAAKQSATLRGGQVRKCLSRNLTRLLRVQKNPSVLKLGPVSISSLSAHAPGATSSFGLRVSAKIKVSVFIVHVYVDILGFVHHSAEVTLVTSGAPAPFPAATEQQLFSLLVARANGERL